MNTDPNQITLSTGVVVRARAINTLLIEDAVARIPEPMPPLRYIAEREREEYDEQDRMYLREVRQRNRQIGNVTTAILFAYGVEVVSVPEGVPSPDGDWESELASTGFHLNGDHRGAAWLKYFGVGEGEDAAILISTILRKSGVLEEDVQRMMAGFQRATARGTDPVPESAPSRSDRDRVPDAPARTHRRIRGT